MAGMAGMTASTRRPAAVIHTLGCKVNQQESEAIARGLVSLGFVIRAVGEHADAHIINSCTVTSVADQKTRQKISQAKALDPDSVVCVIGCLAQTDGGALSAMPQVGIVVPSGEKERTADIVAEAVYGRMGAGGAMPGGMSAARRKVARTRALLKIEDGCDRFCAYCIVPYARGAVRSRPQEGILDEARALLASGYKEIVVTGINIALYGQDLGEPDALPNLLERLCHLSGEAGGGEYRVRLGSLEPTVIDAGQAARIARIPGICPQFHLSLQSGSDHTLAQMGRPYRTADYRKIVEALRTLDPHFGITTDVIAGFPGESDADFDRSLAFVESIGFSRMHVFPYSRRAGTRAANMPGCIPSTVKAVRAQRLLEAAGRGADAFRARNAGRTRRTLLLEWNKGKGTMHGLTDNGIDVRIPKTQSGTCDAHAPLAENTFIDLKL